MFNINEYMKELTVPKDDHEYVKTMDVIQLTEILCDDAYLTRAAYFGTAGSMERQITYLNTTLIPAAERKVGQMSGTGILSESYTGDSWFGHTNEDQPHINDEIPKDQRLDDQQTRLGELVTRSRRAGIIFGCYVRAHDEISRALNPQQLTYGHIKSKAEANRMVTRDKAA